MLKVCLFSSNSITFTSAKRTHMKIFTSILVVIALALIIFNVTLLDFDHLFEGNSIVALIGIAAAFCAVCILLIFKMSKMIVEKTKDQ